MFLPANNETSELWGIYCWWGMVLILEIITLMWFTGRYRVHYKVIHCEADKIWFEGSADITLDPTGSGHPEVDRIRSAHFSDVQFIFLYLVITPMWIFTSPSVSTAKIVLRLFPVSRILHTTFYMNLIEVHKMYQLIALLINYFSLSYIVISNAIFYYSA